MAVEPRLGWNSHLLIPNFGNAAPAAHGSHRGKGNAQDPLVNPATASAPANDVHPQDAVLGAGAGAGSGPKPAIPAASVLPLNLRPQCTGEKAGAPPLPK